ncbi:MAG: hypothetical protein KDJ35_07270 [Alphaproteobacteria bacterium]|nr:hypothetical protein [Alphaproteobacteria bacterium]
MAYVLRAFTLLIFATLILLAPGLATAQTPQEQLTQIFQTLIQSQKDKAAADDAADMTFDGDVMVEPSGDFYAITLPHITIKHQNGDVMDIGIISINASASEQAGQWKMSVAVPSAMTMKDKDGQDIMRLMIGQQNTAGIWDEELKNFAKLEADYGDIRVESADPDYKLSLPALSIRHNFEKDANGLWSGPYSATAKDLTLRVKDDNTTISLKNIKMALDLDRYDAKKTNALREKVSQLRLNQEQMTPEDKIALINAVIDGALQSGNGFTNDYTLSGLRIQYDDKFGKKGDMSLEQAGFTLSLLGFLQNNVTMGLRFHHQGFKIENQKAEYASFDPSNSNIELSLENLPIKDVINMSRNAIGAMIAQPQTAALAGMSVVMKIPVLLSQAKTALTIKDSFVSSDDYKVTMNGQVIADMSAVNSATGTAHAEFQGLDKVLAKAQVLATDPDNQDADKFEKMRKNLEFLKTIGKVETGPDSQFVHIYDIIMNPAGQILINGTDLKFLKQPAPAKKEDTKPADD